VKFALLLFAVASTAGFEKPLPAAPAGLITTTVQPVCGEGSCRCRLLFTGETRVNEWNETQKKYVCSCHKEHVWWMLAWR